MVAPKHLKCLGVIAQQKDKEKSSSGTSFNCHFYKFQYLFLKSGLKI